jgi:hypothetical protein
MAVVPDPSRLEGLPTDPNNGGAYVLLKGTSLMFTSWCPLAHAREPDSKLKRKATSLHSGLLAGCRDVFGRRGDSEVDRRRGLVLLDYFRLATTHSESHWSSDRVIV